MLNQNDLFIGQSIVLIKDCFKYGEGKIGDKGVVQHISFTQVGIKLEKGKFIYVYYDEIEKLQINKIAPKP